MTFKVIVFCMFVFALNYCEALTPEGFVSLENNANSQTDNTIHTNDNREQSINLPNGIISNIGYFAADGASFDGRTSGFLGDSTGTGDRKCMSTSTDPYADHEIVMQSHDVLEGVRVWVNDNDVDENLRVIVYESCLPTFSADFIDSNILLSEDFIASSGFASQYFPINKSYRGRHDDCKIMARIRFGSSFSNCSSAPNIFLQKFRAQLRLNDLIFADGFE